jgi:hypothetical protein
VHRRCGQIREHELRDAERAHLKSEKIHAHELHDLTHRALAGDVLEAIAIGEAVARHDAKAGHPTDVKRDIAEAFIIEEVVKHHDQKTGHGGGPHARGKEALETIALEEALNKRREGHEHRALAGDILEAVVIGEAIAYHDAQAGRPSDVKRDIAEALIIEEVVKHHAQRTGHADDPHARGKEALEVIMIEEMLNKRRASHGGRALAGELLEAAVIGEAVAHHDGATTKQGRERDVAEALVIEEVIRHHDQKTGHANDPHARGKEALETILIEEALNKRREGQH